MLVKQIACPHCGTTNNVMAVGVDYSTCRECGGRITVVQGEVLEAQETVLTEKETEAPS